MGLKDLIAMGPDQRYTVKAEVLASFDDITMARSLMRTWPDITAAMGFDRGKWKQVSACYRRVKKGVESGRLQVPKSGKARQGVSVVAAKQPSRSGIIDLDDPANQ